VKGPEGRIDESNIEEKERMKGCLDEIRVAKSLATSEKD
jgi:hypothetical protein